MNPLNRRAMLVRLSIHAWRGRKIDKSAAKAAATELKIEGGSDEYYKFLVPKNAFRPLIAHHNNVRFAHHRYTFPWFDDGLRVLPSAQYFTYTKAMHAFRDTQSELVEDFLSQYENYKEYARVNRAAIFNEKDYPAIDDLRRMFDIELNFLPFPDATDFRVEIDQAALGELKTQIVAEQTRVISAHKEEMVVRLKERLLRMASMCNPALPDNRVFDSTIETFNDVVDMADKLNIMEDPLIKSIVAACKTWLTSVEAETLRNSPETRQRVYDAAKEILEMVNNGR